MSEAAHPVFLSYARQASLVAARALAERLGTNNAFLDIDGVALRDTFPAVLQDAVLDARIMVVFVSEAYFTRPYCWREWELGLAPWHTLLQRHADAAALEQALAHIVLVMPEGEARIPSDRLPPSPRLQNWPHVGQLDVVAEFIGERLRQVKHSIGTTLDTLGARDAVAPVGGGTDLLLPVRPLVGRLVLDRAATSLDKEFVGRAVELYQLDELLRPGDGGRGGLVAVTAAVVASGGFGKSRLALEYVWRYQALRFPGGVFWIDADVVSEALEAQWYAVLRTFVPDLPSLAQFQALGGDVADELDEALRLHHDPEKPVLVVLDNVPEPRPCEALASREDLFPGRRWVTLLATSRRRIDEARAATLSIGVLHPNEARRLLLQNVVHRDGVTEAEWDAVATWVGHLPLALELLNRALVHLVLSPVKLREITQERSPVWVGDALREGLRGHVADGALRGISETLRITSERLPETARRVARVSAWLAPAPVPEPLIEALCNGTDITATRALLESRSVWIRGLNSATWSMHELVADYFRVTSPNPLADWRMAVRALNTLVEGDAATRAELRPVLFALVAAAGELASRIPEVANLADGQALRRTAGWLSDLGESSGTPAALMVARRLIERGVNSLLTRDLAPHDWAQAQNNLGRVLWILGKRGGEETTLEQAIGAYRGALEVFTRPSVPTAWALVMNNLGNALRDLGELRGDVATLERSAEAFVATLEVYSYGETPMRWAGTQNNLGTVYQFLGERRGDEAALKQAIDAYQAALEVRTQSDTAMDWAMTQSNLGAALGTLGALRENEDTLEKAIDAYCEALEVYSRRETPVEWAMTLSNLGNLLQVLGAHRGDEVALEQAVDTFHDVLEVYTRQAARFDWARTQNNLGTALHALGERREGEEELQQAIGAYRLALEVLTRNATAAGWARTQNNLGNVLRVLGERCGDEEILRQAIAAYEAALEVRTRKADQVGWARTQNNLGNVFRVFSTLVGSEAFRRQAVEAYLKALEVLESLGHHHAIRVTRRNLDLVGG